jgi:hypothetical protein
VEEKAEELIELYFEQFGRSECRFLP